MKGINEGYSGVMTKLRICIGLIATALFVSALPAHAESSFKSVKVCAKFENKTVIANVDFAWTFAGKLVDQAKTDQSGCFLALNMPIGKVSIFPNGVLELASPIKNGAPQEINLASIPVRQIDPWAYDTRALNKLTIIFKSPPKYPQLITKYLTVVDQDRNFVPSQFLLRSVPSESGCNQQSFDRSSGFGIIGLFTDATYSAGPPPRTDWTTGVFPVNFKKFISQQTTGLKLNASVFGKLQINFLNTTSHAKSDPAIACVRARTAGNWNYVDGQSGQPVDSQYIYWAPDPESTSETLAYSHNQFGFSISSSGLIKHGVKTSLDVILRDIDGNPAQFVVVTASEPNAKNPNVGKRNGKCVPRLKSVTDLGGNAEFILCPTKNTTISVTASRLGVSSWAIPVSK